MSNETKVTAVEWLIPKILELNLQLSLRKISARNCELKIAKLFEQAQAMEKEQHNEAFDEGIKSDYYSQFEQYYTETYGK